MNPSDYTKWMERAFLYMEGDLLKRSAHDSPSKIHEETIRSALIDGLKHAKPARASDVFDETDVSWNLAKDINIPMRKFGKGRSKQHDVSIRSGSDVNLVVEVKWLTKMNHVELMEDVWKLALSHGANVPEKNCCRTFLLVGGLKDPFQKSLQALRKRHLPLRWSPQGRAAGWPAPHSINLGNLANSVDGGNALIAALRRRPAGKPNPYHRTPPTVWWKMRCSLVARSWKTIRGSQWKIALWELDYKKATCGGVQVDWTPLAGLLP